MYGLLRRRPAAGGGCPHSAASTLLVLSPDLPDVWDAPPQAPPPNYQAGTDTRRSAPTIIEGKLISDEIRSGIAEEVCRMKETIGRVPGLAVVLVGQRRDSQTYVRNKIKACQEAGIKSLMAVFPESSSEDEVLETVLDFNNDPSVHAYGRGENFGCY